MALSQSLEFMMDWAKAIYEAFGTPDPRIFVTGCALLGAMIFGFGGWVIQSQYHAKTHPTITEAKPPTPAVVAPPEKPPIPAIKIDGNNKEVNVNGNTFDGTQFAVHAGPNIDKLNINNNKFKAASALLADKATVTAFVQDYLDSYPEENRRIRAGASPAPLEAWVNGKLKEKGFVSTVRIEKLQGRNGLDVTIINSKPES